MKIISNKYSIMIYYKTSNTKLACAEASIMNIDTFYFNRIFVPKEMRGQKIGTLLLNKLLQIIKDKNVSLICEPNPYGDLNYKQLKNWYIKNGFIFNEKDKYLIYNQKERES